MALPGESFPNGAVSTEELRSELSSAQGRLRVMESIANGAPLGDILEACLSFCESHSPGLIASILLLENGDTLRHGAAPRLPEAYIRAVDGSAIGPSAGSCGTAAFRGQPVFVADIATDPLWENYRQLALPHGLRSCWSTPILDGHQAVLGTFAIYYPEPGDPPDRHLALIGMVTHLAALAISRRREEVERRRIFERISDGFVALDRRWCYTYVNEKAGRMFGKDPESLVGRHIWTEFPEGVGQKFHQAYERALRDQVPERLEEYYPPYDRWFENRIYPSPEGLSIYFLDVTERRREEESRRSAEKLTSLGMLASGVAHDFNNHLSLILGYADLLADKLRDAELKPHVEAIVSAARISGELTRGLLTFARQSPLEAVPLDLHELILEALALAKAGLPPGIRVRPRLEAQRSQVLGDPAGLQNALLNLVFNARDAMPDGGEIRVTTALEGPGALEGPPRNALRLTVADSGHGMSEAVRKRVFEPFFTTKPPGKGTGMGLASVFGTVQALGGRISVESAPGKGAAFHVLLPLFQPRQS